VSPEELSRKIITSKKYSSLYPKTVLRIVKDCLSKYPEKEVEKKARQLLHQIWGIFYPTRPDFNKLLKAFGAKIKNREDVKEAVWSILKLHASTKERTPILNDFYRRIFKITGRPKTIVDLASGLNPLTYFWLPEGIEYHGFDIDREQAQFLTAIFKLLKVNRVKIGLGDVFVDRFPKADVVFLLKILPLIRQQQKTQSLEILEKQNARHLVVSFPTKTVSGREKGMAEFYAKQFEELIREKPWAIKKIFFPTELVFVIKK
jgi:16S rRNA (guanine(1405)-N(7))-methyltransferase